MEEMFSGENAEELSINGNDHDASDEEFAAGHEPVPDLPYSDNDEEKQEDPVEEKSDDGGDQVDDEGSLDEEEAGAVC